MHISPNKLTPMKFTQSVHQRSRGYSPKNQRAAPRLTQKRYFFHFLNGVYMGGIESFRKNGKAIILLDDGACLITNYSNNSMFGHNIIFHRNSITSILVDNHGNRDVCFRFQEYILQIFMNQKNQITGQGYLLNLKDSTIFYLKFKNSKLTSKVNIQEDNVKEKIFNERYYEYLVSNPHAETMRLEIKGLGDIKLQEQHTNKYVVGFKGQSKNIEGLGFKFELANIDSKLELTIKERGRYDNQGLNQYGETYFENGNYYIGNFRNGRYNGTGVLVDPKAKKWTFGNYFDHQLIQILDSSIHSQFSPHKSTRSQFSPHKSTRKHKTLATIIREFHKFDRSFIQEEIKIFPTHCFVEGVLQMLLKQNSVKCEVLNFRAVEEDNSQRLHKIYTDFTKGNYQEETEEAIRGISKQKDKSRVVLGEQSDKKQIQKDKQKIKKIAQRVKNHIALNQLEPLETFRGDDQTQTEVKTPNSPSHEFPRDQPYFKSPLKTNYEPSQYSRLIDPYLNSRWRTYKATQIYPHYQQTLTEPKESRKKTRYQYTDIKQFEIFSNSSPYSRAYSPIRR